MRKYLLFCLAIACLFSLLITINEYILHQSLGVSQNWALDSLFTSITLVVWAVIVPYLYPFLKRKVGEIGYKELIHLFFISVTLAIANATVSNLVFHGSLSVLGLNEEWTLSDLPTLVHQVGSGLFYRWIETALLLLVLLIIIRNEFRILNWIDQHLPSLSWLKGTTIDFIVTKVNGLDHVVQAKDVVLIESNGNYVNLHTREDKIIHRQTITELEQLLNKQMFHRVHRSFLVNRDHVKRVTPYKQGEYFLELSNEMKIRTSRKYKRQALLLSQVD